MRTEKDFKVFYQKVPGGYMIDHSAGTFTCDPQGWLRLYVADGPASDMFGHDLRERLRASS